MARKSSSREPSEPNERFSFVEAPRSTSTTTFAEAVLTGLSVSPKTLPCMYFYDARGSKLFDRICELPEYYLTRAEHSILNSKRCDMIAAAGAPMELIEFGSGSAVKTRLLLEAALDLMSHIVYIPVDISRGHLAYTAEKLLSEFPGLSVHAIAGEYRDGVAYLSESLGRRLYLFMGSNIGNLTDKEASAFLSDIRAIMDPNDRLLVGADLVKEQSIIEAAYNDSKGLTAQFNKNILRRINEGLGGQFDLDAFGHSAPFVRRESRIEMHLVSKRKQRVEVKTLGKTFSFEKGETIMTEICQKYTLPRLAEIGAGAGLTMARTWTDDRGWFAVSLLTPMEGEPATESGRDAKGRSVSRARKERK